jgi:hypothetical protein
MEPNFSEFSFGYALTENFVNRNSGLITGHPIFPSLLEEGRTGGYDLQLPRFGFPLFLQFKLSDYMIRSYAENWDLFNCPHYRMYVRPLRYSNQHNLLRDLESQGNEVYYAAPRFHSSEELNEAYLNSQVIERTAFFSPNDIGALPDDYYHYLAFTRTSRFAYFCSESGKELERWYSGKQFIEREKQVLLSKGKELSASFFSQISNNIIKIEVGWI